MKMGLNLILLISFAFSLSVGEDLCCSDIFEPSDSNHISQSVSLKQSAQETHPDAHICEGRSHSDKSNHDKHHACIGCSHAPFMHPSNIFISSTNLIHKTFYFDKIIFISHPFLDGPYQPPRA